MNEIFTRASVRKFKPIPVEKTQVEQLLRAAMAAPSAGNQQIWEFIVVDDQKLIATLAATSPYAAALKTATLAIVIVAKNSGTRLFDYWQQDCGAATENILLEAVSLGLGGVWLGIAPQSERMKMISELLSLPETVLPFNIIALGVPEIQPHQQDRFDPEKIHTNKY